MKKNALWKTAAAGAILAAIVLAGFAVAGVKPAERRLRPRPAQIQAAPAARPHQGRILFQSRVGKGPWQIYSLDLSTRRPDPPDPFVVRRPLSQRLTGRHLDRF